MAADDSTDSARCPVGVLMMRKGISLLLSNFEAAAKSSLITLHTQTQPLCLASHISSRGEASTTPWTLAVRTVVAATVDGMRRQQDSSCLLCVVRHAWAPAYAACALLLPMTLLHALLYSCHPCGQCCDYEAQHAAK